MAWVGNPKMGAALPPGPGGGQGTERRGGRKNRRGQRKPEAPGAPEDFPQSGNEPWGGAFRESVSAPQHASDLINPVGRAPGSGGRTDRGELQK